MPLTWSKDLGWNYYNKRQHLSYILEQCKTTSVYAWQVEKNKNQSSIIVMMCTWQLTNSKPTEHTKIFMTMFPNGLHKICAKTDTRFYNISLVWFYWWQTRRAFTLVISDLNTCMTLLYLYRTTQWTTWIMQIKHWLRRNRVWSNKQIY